MAADAGGQGTHARTHARSSHAAAASGRAGRRDLWMSHHEIHVVSVWAEEQVQEQASPQADDRFTVRIREGKAMELRRG